MVRYDYVHPTDGSRRTLSFSYHDADQSRREALNAALNVARIYYAQDMDTSVLPTDQQAVFQAALSGEPLPEQANGTSGLVRAIEEGLIIPGEQVVFSPAITNSRVSTRDPNGDTYSAKNGGTFR